MVIFDKKTLTINPIIFYGRALIRHTVEDREYIRPIILRYQSDSWYSIENILDQSF